MMGNDNNQDSKNGLITILLLIMMVTGTAINNPLISSRPFESQNSKLISPETHKVDARLWQDPIASIGKHVLQMKEPDTGQLKETNSFDNFIKEIPNRVNKSNDLRVIAISVFGSSYPELVEFRQRYRYAVVSALGSRGYFSQDNEHLGFFLFNTHLANNCEIYVPYEWFERDQGSGSSNKERLLILWLNEEKIISTQYGNFIKNLFDRFSEVQSNKSSFTLIGPTNTSKLVELMKSTDIDELPASFKIISSSATISDNDLFNAYEKENQCNQSNEDKKRDCIKKEIAGRLTKKSIIRTIGQDENLAKALIWELGQRGVNREIPFIKDKCEDGLIIISEQDSLYARALTQHFIDAVGTQCEKEQTGKSLVTNFTYLRGLDGKLPDLDESNKKSQDTQDKKEKKNLIAQLDDASLEHAEGRNQFDYLQRLIDRIEELDRREGLGTNRIKAIGIFGNDVYDKLLILQALRDRFKHKIFFTTELDARYLHADQTKWARNLVVASNFDLTLRSELQGSIMPFRDSYQTSMYLATLLALNSRMVKVAVPEIKPAIDKKQEIQKEQKEPKKQIQVEQEALNKLLIPQIFEIGRTQAVHLATFNTHVDLSNDRVLTSSECDFNKILSCLSIEQSRIKSFDGDAKLGLVIVFSLALFIIFAKPVTDRVIAFFSNKELKHPIAIYILWILFLVFLFSICSDIYPTHHLGEPFYWFEGISVWPNLVIRFFGIIVILITFFYYYNKFKNAEEVKKDFIETKEGIEVGEINRYWWEALREGPFLNFASENKNIRDVLLEYLTISDYSKSRGYLWIICAALVSLFITAYILLSLGYLNFPFRGGTTQYWHYCLAFLQFLILWGLVYWVGYEATACRRFIDQLEPKESFTEQPDWPLAFMEKHEKRTGISRKELIPYFRFLLITRLIKRINNIIYIPFILMFLIAIGRSNVFDNLGFSPALIMVFIGASAYLVATLIMLRKSAEKQCGDILQYYEEYRVGRISLAFGNANTMDQVVAEIRNKKQQTFARFLQRPSLLAVLLPGGGIGLTSIIEYLYN